MTRYCLQHNSPELLEQLALVLCISRGSKTLGRTAAQRYATVQQQYSHMGSRQQEESVSKGICSSSLLIDNGSTRRTLNNKPLSVYQLPHLIILL